MILRLFLFFFLTGLALDNSLAQAKLSPCPNSPNCVSTQALKKRKRMEALPYTETISESKKRLRELISQIPRTQLVEEEAHTLHFTFKTKIGKFTDDVHFLWDPEQQVIHFRSASRKGWSDLGANRRRMKKISKRYHGGG